MKNIYSQPTIDYDELMSKMASLTDEQIQQLIGQARLLGIPQYQINQGIQIINKAKK